MKRLRVVFELTVPEQRTVTILLGVLLAVVAVKTYRAERPTRPPAEVQPSPSPGILP